MCGQLITSINHRLFAIDLCHHSENTCSPQITKIEKEGNHF